MENIKKMPQVKSEVAVQRCSINKVFLEILQNSHENTWAGGFFNKDSALRAATLLNIKKETLAQVFSCEFCETYRSTFFIEHLWWLLL